ncbi:gluconate 2-dehydrogenase subunit 3 family protein [Pedobacter hartonius]|uniref:Gluconate 2-dehydrogenase subunit 3 n=1 Tax=Pedobacter hartonius TaxID=425514 RepID=A0A1H4HJ37_9SPHI|nr:gluconate 2-dehydrogenase subunit 3 family protein [Pedobacter hartonius]SEB21082.1 Gluconate 2-dehydrogenase subunit 3 [Pedobacter hartonius]
MDRRTAISRVAMILGSTIIGADLFISGCTNEHPAQVQALLTDAQVSYLNEVGETILPKTAASDGAKAANVGAFMKIMVRDCYSPEDRQIFFDGLDALEQRCKKTLGKGFLSSSLEERQKLLITLDAEVKDGKKRNDLLQQKEAERQKSSQAGGKPNYLKKTPPTPYFAMIKQLTLLGYFTSEIGYKSIGYVSVPGRYDGNVTKS